MLQRNAPRGMSKWRGKSFSSFRASTWPRPRGRGMFYVCHDALHGLWASTWPRPRGRGMVHFQNRAALSGIASTWPRPRGRGMNKMDGKIFRSVVLQRGRARAGAE